MFKATKRELGEIYAFFRLLADGSVYMGTPQVQKDMNRCWPVALVQREEHDGTRRYYIEEDEVRMVSGEVDRSGRGRAVCAEGGGGAGHFSKGRLW